MNETGYLIMFLVGVVVLFPIIVAGLFGWPKKIWNIIPPLRSWRNHVFQLEDGSAALVFKGKMLNYVVVGREKTIQIPKRNTSVQVVHVHEPHEFHSYFTVTHPLEDGYTASMDLEAHGRTRNPIQLASLHGREWKKTSLFKALDPEIANILRLSTFHDLESSLQDFPANVWRHYSRLPKDPSLEVTDLTLTRVSLSPTEKITASFDELERQRTSTSNESEGEERIIGG